MNISPYDCVKIKTQGRELHIDVDYHKYMECLKTDNSQKLNLDHNRKEFKVQVFGNSKEDIKFKGGRYEDLYSDRSIDLYHQYKKELKNNEFFKKIEEKLIKQNKRRRVFTDKDGDFDYDRRFEINPYNSIVKMKQNKRIVDFNIHTGFSWQVDQVIINKYAAIVCILNDIFNTFGIATNIYNIKHTCKVTSDSSTDLIAKIKIKDSSSYSTTQTILKSIDSVFYRRTGFSLSILAADHVNKIVAYGLGEPKRYEKHFEFKHGEINIYSGFHADQHMDKFFKDLYENI